MSFQANLLTQRVGKILACMLVMTQIAPVMAGASQPSANLVLSDDIIEYRIKSPAIVKKTSLAPIIETTEISPPQKADIPVEDIAVEIAAPAKPALPPLEQAGQFALIAQDIVAFSGEVDSYSPDNFARMLAHNPGITTLELHDVAGTIDDIANFRLARMIRDAGLTIYVPSDASVRSGGIELFAAGARRIVEPGAEFLVHSWQDDAGYEAGDYPLSDPIHQEYLRFYREMGLAADDATGFYLLTNSAPFDDALQLSLHDLQRFGLI